MKHLYNLFPLIVSTHYLKVVKFIYIPIIFCPHVECLINILVVSTETKFEFDSPPEVLVQAWFDKPFCMYFASAKIFIQCIIPFNR